VSTAPVARRFIVTGKVQGVWYRAAAVEAAQELGVTGWARNCSDGSVEMLAVGAPEALDALAAWAHAGPPKAVVAQVAVSDIDLPDPQPTDFTIVADA
jgi:acylphosphatase